MTGAVASKNVTEAYKGRLKSYRNGLLECNGISRLDCKWYITSPPSLKSFGGSLEARKGGVGQVRKQVIVIPLYLMEGEGLNG